MAEATPPLKRGVSRTISFVAALLSLAFAAGSAFYFWQTTRYSDITYTASRLEAGKTVAPDVVARLASTLGGLVDAGECRSDILASAVSVALADLDARDALADYDGWAASISAADRLLAFATTCVPTNGNFWARLAMLRQAEAENPTELAGLIDRSVWFAPSESGVIAARCVIWRKATDETLRLARHSLDHDLMTVLTYFQPNAALSCLDGGGPTLQTAAAEAARAVNDDRLLTLNRTGLTWLGTPVVGKPDELPKPIVDPLAPRAKP